MWMATVTNGNSNETNQKLTHLLHLTNETKKIENEHKENQARKKNTAEAQLAQAKSEIEFYYSTKSSELCEIGYSN